MAKFYVTQIDYLSQDLIDHIRNAHNLIGRGTVELARAQQTLKMLMAAQDQWIHEVELDSENA